MHPRFCMCVCRTQPIERGRSACWAGEIVGQSAICHSREFGERHTHTHATLFGFWLKYQPSITSEFSLQRPCARSAKREREREREREKVALNCQKLNRVVSCKKEIRKVNLNCALLPRCVSVCCLYGLRLMGAVIKREQRLCGYDLDASSELDTGYWICAHSTTPFQ